MSDKSEYKNRKKQGTCVKCGKRDARTENGLTLCIVCAKKDRVYKKRYSKTKKGKKMAQQANKAQYYRRKQLGLCTICGDPVEERRKGKIYCRACAEKRNDSVILTEQDKAMGQLIKLVLGNGKVLNNG